MCFSPSVKAGSVIITFALLIFCGISNAEKSQEKADLVVVEKSKHLLSIYKANKLLASYHVAFGGSPTGNKQKEGDKKTPEGRYILDYRIENNAYHKAFHVSYPNAKDTENARKLGVSPGSAIMVHGQKNGFDWASSIVQRFNWTKGCVALANQDLDQMWSIVNVGTPIEIKP